VGWVGLGQSANGLGSELSMGWVNPWVGLGWVGSGWFGLGRNYLFFLVGWLGLGPLQKKY